MQLTIYRGTHEIGGNCVELATSTTRIIIDVGMPLVDSAGEPFDSRAVRGKNIAELTANGTLPKVPGLFDRNAPPPHAMLLSHAHLDHTGLLRFARSNIPVFLSKGTSKMMLAGSIFAGQPELKKGRGTVFGPGRPFAVGDFRITAYPVDHSAFDSMAFLIEADGKRILYSGDLRLHGRKPGMAKNLIAAARKQSVDLLLMEGTHFGADRKRGVTEKELEEQALEHIRQTNGIVLALFSPMHVDRLVTFYKAAKRSGRIFVVDPYAAFVMHLVSGQCHIPRPTARAHIRVYYNRHFETTYQRRKLRKIFDMFQEDRITEQEILERPERHVMIYRISMAKLDFGGGIIPAGARCLYSYWDGYLKRPEWTEFIERVKSAGGDFLECHTSGHIFAEDIVEFVRAVGPRTVVPIHTFEPWQFQKHFPNVEKLTDGQPYTLG
jgi:ribonuclease J